MSERPLTEIPISTEEMRRFQDLVYHSAGIRLPDSKLALVQNRLRKRLAACACPSYTAYHRLVADPQQETERQRCLEALTTNETFFFRHHQHWDLLAQTLVPDWQARHGAGAIFRFWSAACSSGEEAYSAAILLSECFAKQSGQGVAIEASDLNQQVLDRARVGRYSAYALQKCSPRCIERYFSCQDEHYELDPAIRRMVHFSRHNLLDTPPGRPCAVIFLRNVLIYFDPASKRRVLAGICQRLAPGGYLFLGGAESLGQLTTALVYERPGIYRKEQP